MSAAVCSALCSVLGVEAVSDLIRLSGGATRETWSFTARTPTGHEEPMVLQMSGPQSPLSTDAEAQVLRVLRHAGVAVPDVVAAGPATDAVFGRPYLIARRVPGETIPRKIHRDPEFERARGCVVEQLAHSLAAMQSIDPVTLPELPSDDPFTWCEDSLEAEGQAHPTFELALRWLRANRPPTTQRTLVHGDFRLGNLIVGAEGLTAIIDWEGAHIGDPAEDIAWLCLRAWRFGGAGAVAGLGDLDTFFKAYRSAGGATSRDGLLWWEILGTLRWGVGCIQHATGYLKGERSHESAAIGRRACENEYDILALLRTAIGTP